MIRVVYKRLFLACALLGSLVLTGCVGGERARIHGVEFEFTRDGKIEVVDGDDPSLAGPSWINYHLWVNTSGVYVSPASEPDSSLGEPLSPRFWNNSYPSPGFI